MSRRALAWRLLVAACAVGSMGTLCATGPDCGQACDVVSHCKGLNKTFYLSCSSLGYSCQDATPGGFGLASCAACIDRSSTTCAGLVAGACDPQCVPGFISVAPLPPGSADGGSSRDGGP